MKSIFHARKTSFILLSLLLCIGCSSNTEHFTFNEVDSFVKAQPVWPANKEKEKNLTVSFRQIIHIDKQACSYLRITASTDYRAYVNGKFLAHGPCVAAHDFYRIDSYEITDLLNSGENIVAIEVSGYNEPSYYLLDQPSFLQAEIEVAGRIVAATGNPDNFSAYLLKQRKPDVPRYSFQRPFTEYYILTPGYDKWLHSLLWNDLPPERCVVQPAKKIIARGVPYPDYSIINSAQISDSLYAFSRNSSGFLGIMTKVKTPAKLTLFFDEIKFGNDINPSRMGTQNYIIYELQPGNYTLESFEPYTMQYVKTKIEGDCDILSIYMRNYVNSDVHRAQFESSDMEMNVLFEAARETARQNAIDIFMDCPSRERAGWLCDSYFSSRVAFNLSGYTHIEHNFLQNFLLPDHFENLPKGMLPMCYPSDHVNKNFIPNWAMWFVLELEEYEERSGDTDLIMQLKPKVYDLIDYFKKFRNSDGLLEKLEKWVFVEWSEANSFVQDVNYPTNMLYAAMLQAARNLYDDPLLANEAEKIRKTIRQQSYDGNFFCDHAIRDGDTLKVVKKDRTEVCQYYAFFFKIATPESYPELWEKLQKEFGPSRKTDNRHPDIYFANAFIGNYLRLELLSEYGYVKQLIGESLENFIPMAKTTGTLWENMDKTQGSCNHGFAAHLIHVFYRDILGVKSISPLQKEIKICFNDTDLEYCKGKIPVMDSHIFLSWEKNGDTISYQLEVPDNYRVSIENHSGCHLQKR